MIVPLHIASGSFFEDKARQQYRKKFAKSLL